MIKFKKTEFTEDDRLMLFQILEIVNQSNLSCSEGKERGTHKYLEYIKNRREHEERLKK